MYRITVQYLHVKWCCLALSEWSLHKQHAVSINIVTLKFV